MGIEIRRAVPEDAVAACGVLRRSIVECCVGDHQHDRQVLDAWLGNKTPDNVASWLQIPSNYTIVALRDGALVGVSLLTQAGKLSLCYVVPEALHCGIGKAMLQQVEQQALAWGVSMIRLHSTATARAFFARNGYISAGRDRSCFGLECDLFWKKLSTEPVAGRVKFCPCNAE